MLEDTDTAGDMVPAMALHADHEAPVSRTRTEILSPDLVRMTEGGTVTLECVVTEHDQPPPAFIWYSADTYSDCQIRVG